MCRKCVENVSEMCRKCVGNVSEMCLEDGIIVVNIIIDIGGGLGGPGGGVGGPGGGFSDDRSSGKPLLLLRLKEPPP